MPITSIGSYITTAGNFTAHWPDVNDDRVANSLTELLLTGGYSLTNFIADRDGLSDAIDAVIGLENANVLASGDRKALKLNLLDRLRQFRAAMILHFKGSPHADAAPRVPRSTASETKILRALIDMADLWTRLNASGGIAGFTPPLLLRAGYTLAGFIADIAALRVAYRDVDDAENDLEMARRQRDALLDPLRQRMLQYRAAILLEYGEGHPFTQSLPDVSPSSGSGTQVDTFGYNYQVSEPNTVAWFQMSAGLVGVTNVKFVEGGQEVTANVDLNPGQSQQVVLTGIVVSGDIDEVVLRDSENNILAVGVRDLELTDPGP